MSIILIMEKKLLIFFAFLPLFGIKAQDCNPEFRPLLFVHGFLASGDTFHHQEVRFKADGYCDDRIWVYDWNTLNRSPQAIDSLDRLIDYIRESTGFDQVDLAGHSAGGGLGYQYLIDANRAAKVAHYIHIGSSKAPTPAGPKDMVPMLNIWSPGDKVVPGGDIEGASNARMEAMDHYEVATSRGSYEQMFRFLTKQEPKEEIMEPLPVVKIAGRVLSLGENIAEAGAEIIAYPVEADGSYDPSKGKSLRTDAAGNYSMEIPSKAHLFKVIPQSGRTVFYFVEGMLANTRLLYFRTLPKPGTMASLMFGGLPREGDELAAILFGANRAFTHGRDKLQFNAHVLTTPDLTSADITTISMVLYDDGNKETSLASIGPFANFPFLVGVDMYLSGDNKTHTIKVNERSVNIPHIKAEEGIMVVVLDL
jgi:pimeloyl-ACP methyl ester carboxylesterase